MANAEIGEATQVLPLGGNPKSTAKMGRLLCLVASLPNILDSQLRPKTSLQTGWEHKK